MDLVYIFKVLLRKWWIIVTLPIIAAVAAYFFTKNQERLYKSSAQLSTGFTTKDRVTLNNESFDYWESRANFENLVEVMKSELIGSMVSYQLIIHDLENQGPYRALEAPSHLKDSIISTLNQKRQNFELLSSYNPFENQILDVIHKAKYKFTDWVENRDLTIARIRDTDYVRIEFASENPFLSAFVINTLCEEYIRYYNGIKNNVTEQSLEFFDNLVQKKKVILDEKTKAVSDFKSESQIFNYDRESGSKFTQLAEYQIRQQEEINKINGLSISLRQQNTNIDNFSGATETVDNSKLLELRRKITQLNQAYVEGGSKDEDIKNLLGELRGQLQVEMAKLARQSQKTEGGKSYEELVAERDQTSLDLEIARSNLASINSTIGTLQSSVSNIGSKEAIISSMERERENAFMDYTNAVDKYNEAKSKSLITSTGVSVMIKAQPNPEPESTKALIIIALAFMGSFAACVGVIIMLEYFDLRIKTPTIFQAITKLPLLGYVFTVDTNKINIKHLFVKKGEEREDEKTIKHLLRKIRYFVEDSGKRVILISSTSQGVGKTFILMNLANSLSMLNKKVLIIDTNFKNNSLTELLIAKPMLQEAGKLQFITDGVDHDEPEPEERAGIISPTINENIDIIGSKKGYESPSEIFAGRKFTSMLETLQGAYDYIFLEGASLNDYSDTKELISFADGIIAVFSAKSTLKQTDKESIKFLKNFNGKFMGAILNQVDSKDVKS